MHAAYSPWRELSTERALPSYTQALFEALLVCSLRYETFEESIVLFSLSSVLLPCFCSAFPDR